MSKKKKGVIKRNMEKVLAVPTRTWEVIGGSISLFLGVFFSFTILGIAGTIGDAVRARLFVPHTDGEVAVFGWSFILLTVFLYTLSMYLLLRVRPVSYTRLFTGSVLGFFSWTLFFAASFSAAAGGAMGNALFGFLRHYLAFFSFILIPLGIFGSLYILKLFSPQTVIAWLAVAPDEEESDEEEEEHSEEEEEHSEEEEYHETEEEYDETEEEYREEEKKPKKKKSVKKSGEKYVTPPLNLLSSEKGKGRAGNTKDQAQTIIRTLRNFRVPVEIEKVTVGPTFTRYAARPAEGIRLSKITSLQQNLELALAAHPIRIEAPIPGKSLVGIEVPNSARSLIGLRTLLESKEFKEMKKGLPIVIGKTITGKVFTKDLAKTPHVLVAGTTGAGKSVLIHNFIISLLFSYGPKNLRFLFIDPKRVELTLYRGLPHLYTEPITNPKKALQALAWTVSEMERRYELLEEAGARDIASYNKKISGDDDRMPFLVVVVDELADLMQYSPREIESNITRITQKSRAVGIHLIISTQRPSVNVITGVVKANVPVRIALQVASGIDSRTILDASGAENLIGAGDLLYSSSESKKPVRVQSAFISEDEAKKIADYIIQKNGVVEEVIDVTQQTTGGTGNRDEANGEEDELYAQAREIVIQSQKASTSMLQRKLKIGYSRAARLIDILEEQGVVGPLIGSKPREVLIEQVDTENDG